MDDLALVFYVIEQDVFAETVGFQNRYKVVVVDDCTITHGQARAAAGGKEAAVQIIRSVLSSEVIPLDEVIQTYMQPR